MRLLSLFWRKRWVWAMYIVRRLIKRFWRRRASKPSGQVDQSLVDSLPPAVYTIGGRAMEPVNLVLLGSQARLEAAFVASGWLKSDPPSPVNLFRAFLAGLFNWRYRRAPITPCQVNGHLQDIAFQKPTQGNKMRRRHHVRLWRLPEGTVVGHTAWMASASYDEGIRITWLPMFVTHRIAPDLDHERKLVGAELVAQGARQAGMFTKGGPRVGHNAFGDPYHTDGGVLVLEL